MQLFFLIAFPRIRLIIRPVLAETVSVIKAPSRSVNQKSRLGIRSVSIARPIM